MLPATVLGVCVPDYSFLSALSAVYCLWCPYTVVIIFIFLTILQKKTFWAVAVILTFVVWSETEILKFSIREPRPKEACVQSYGMPSGHSTLSMFFLSMGIVTDALDPGLTVLKKILHSLFYFVVFFPVPFARWYLHYHTLNQCIAGCILGIGNAVLFSAWLYVFDGWKQVEQFFHTSWLEEFQFENPTHLQYSPALNAKESEYV